MNDNNTLARAMLARLFDNEGWVPGSDPEHTLDVACRFWTEGVTASEAVETAKAHMGAG